MGHAFHHLVKPVARVGDKLFTQCGTVLTDKGSKNTYVEGKLIIRNGDKNINHITDPSTKKPCTLMHVTTIKATSKSVWVEGALIARNTDQYEDDTTCWGAPNMFPQIFASQVSVQAG